MLDVAALVQQMRDTLSEIHDTITSLDTKGHDEKLDELESQRDEIFRQLQSAFEKESAELEQRRQAERHEIAEKRRREDEEIAARRRREDEETASRDDDHDAERQHKLESEKESVEQETDEKMDDVEEEARRMLDEGHSKLKDLEERRREINRMIDEQMKAPLPPPPSRRARRSARASSGRVPNQPDSDRQHEPAARLEAEGRRDDELTQAEQKPAEPRPEPSSPEQASPETDSPSQDQPQRQAAGSVSLQKDLGNKPASHDDHSQLHTTGKVDTEVAKSLAEDNAPAAHQVSDEDQHGSGQTPGQAASASAPSDAGDSAQKSPDDEEVVGASSDVKEQELNCDHGQQPSRSLNGADSTDTPSQNPNQALEAENKSIDISPDTAKQATEQSAAGDPQGAPPSHEKPASSDPLAPNEVDTNKTPAAEDKSGQNPSQPAADGPETSDVPSENDGRESPDHDSLFHGVAKGGAAEEYVRMAENESVPEPQIGGNTSAAPDQDPCSGNGQQHEEHRDPGRGFEGPEPTQADISTTEEATPEYTGLAKDDQQPSSATPPADSAEPKGESPVEGEQSSDHLQSRHSESVDQQEPNQEPTLDRQQHRPSEHSGLDHSREPDSSFTGHAHPPAPSPNSPDADSPYGEQIQEPGHGGQPQSGNKSPSSGFQQRDLEPTYHEDTELGTSNSAETSLSEEDHSGSKTAEGQREPHGDEQCGGAPRAMDGEREHPEHDAGSQLESDPAGQQGLSSSNLSVPATPSHDAQVEKNPGGSGEQEGHGGQESPQERTQSQNPKEEHAGGDTEEQLTQESSHDTPNVVEPNELDAPPHELASEHETGGKRSDSGYETGMVSSRSLEDPSATLREGQPAQGAEHSFAIASATASPEGEQEKTRDSRPPEQILEGSGKDASPPRLGGEHDSGSHLVEETFDRSGSGPIPGPVTHGKDQAGNQGEELAGGDVSSHGISHQQPVDNDAVGSTADESRRSLDIYDSRKSPSEYGEGLLPHESSQQADDDHVQSESQPISHEPDSTRSADSESQGTEEQLRQGGSQSAAGTVGHEASGHTEGSMEPSDTTAPQDQGSAPSTGQAEKSYPDDDVKTTAVHGADELPQETPVRGDDAVIPAPQEPVSDQSVSYSSDARDSSQDQFGSWNSRAFSRPAHDHEFSFKKRADSVQVGRSQGLADRGADLPSINTDGPNEDADEGLFAVPPTPRHEVEPERSSRASSRDGSARDDTLPSRAAEGLQDPSSEGNDRASLPETAASENDMDHNDPSHSGGDGPVDVIETPDGPEEKSTVPCDDAGRLLNRGEVGHGRAEGSLATTAGEVAHEASAGNDDSQQGQHHGGVSLQAFENQSESNDRQVDGSRQPETTPREQQHSDVMNKTEAIEDSGETRQNQARDNSDDSDAQPNSSTKKHDLKQGGSGFGHQGEPAQQSLDDASRRDAATEDLNPRDTTNVPDSEQIRQDSGETDNRSLDGNDQVQNGEASESRTPEYQPLDVSPEAVESASDQEVDKKIAGPPRLDQGGTWEPQSGSGSKAGQVEQDHANNGNAARQPLSPGHPSRQSNYDGEGYGVTPSSEYSNDPLAESTAQEQIEPHSANPSTAARQFDTPSNDSPDSAHVTRNDESLDSGSETFETPLESADFHKPQESSRSVTSGNFTRALDHLPDER
ncbi:hypothetical protein KVR01_001561 [Diaporthe batatas]|uniref:uncharacterized protein n=1 Tax=Diaporthe batatas TaxID=748121 RepID=UPI001D048417|nr:uncharacterized protein KVR01_001561 [Diaporthe batatas]KAG8168812.1 hypothetical protein KVR01_001561 [Diaporthe batatas]